MKPRVIIGVPHPWEVNMHWARIMFGNLVFKEVPWCEKDCITEQGYSVAAQRNNIVYKFLKDPRNTHLLFLDTDNIVFQPQDPNKALEMLLEHKQPIATGVYKLKHKIISYSFMKDDPPPEGVQRGWFTTDATGMGFCLIERQVFEKVPPPWFEWQWIPPEKVELSLPSPIEGVTMPNIKLDAEKKEVGEDITFCRKLKDYGFSILVDWRVQLEHIGYLRMGPDGIIRLWG